jgi:hypothetical protein
MKPEKELMKFACSMSRSIDPRRPWKLTAKQSASVNDLPCIVRLAQRAKKLSGAPPGSRREEKYRKAGQRLNSEKQRQRRLLLVALVDRFKKGQPVIDKPDFIDRDCQAIYLGTVPQDDLIRRVGRLPFHTEAPAALTDAQKQCWP